MPDIFDYLDWRGDIPLSADPFNDVDNLILAELAYTEFDEILSGAERPVSLIKAHREFFKTHSREEILEETSLTAKAPLIMDGMVSGGRFRNITLSDYVDIIDTDKGYQFAAVTMRLGDGTAYVAFRGTDSTIVGWKEDFIMSYLPETEGQRKAIEYLNMVGSKLRRPIRVGGHSKGGNFAVYAAAFCKDKVRNKIINVYTNDGPGFRDEVMNDEAYKRIVPLVISIVPDTSVIGMLLASKVRHRVVRSSATGLLQHDGFTWQVMRNGFVPAEISELGRFVMDTQRDWLSKIDDRSREAFVNTLFSLFEATGLDTFGEMSDSKLKSAERILASIQELPREQQREMVKIVRQLFRSSRHAARASIEDLIAELQK